MRTLWIGPRVTSIVAQQVDWLEAGPRGRKKRLSFPSEPNTRSATALINEHDAGGFLGLFDDSSIAAEKIGFVSQKGGAAVLTAVLWRSEEHTWSTTVLANGLAPAALKVLQMNCVASCAPE